MNAERLQQAKLMRYISGHLLLTATAYLSGIVTCPGQYAKMTPLVSAAQIVLAMHMAVRCIG